MPALTFSITNGGVAVTDPLDLGARANGQTTPVQTLFLRHDQTAAITGIGFFISAFVGIYTGAATAAVDLAEILAWGDQAGADNFGGVQVNQDALGGFPDASWPVAGSPVRGNGAVFNNTQGNLSTSAIGLRTSSGAVVAGELLPGATPNVRVQFRVQIPTSETTPGVRLYSLRAVYTFTS